MLKGLKGDRGIYFVIGLGSTSLFPTSIEYNCLGGLTLKIGRLLTQYFIR